MNDFLSETKLLNFSSAPIQELLDSRGWRSLSEGDAIGACYNFVRNEIPLSFNKRDDLPASAVLTEGYGQCNTKGILLMALLRGLHIPCRAHAFMVDKKLQQGLLTGFCYRHAPRRILHSWVEVQYRETWYSLEGFIVDDIYLSALQKKFPTHSDDFCGYAVATDHFSAPPVEWKECDTYIQKEAIIQDLGVYDCPDTLFSEHRQRLGLIKRFLYRNFVRNMMNKRSEQIRRGELP